MKTEKIIDVRDASLKTLTVEIKIVSVSDRQMTLAVYRQIPQENLIDPETAELRGIPWGLVNLCKFNECIDAMLERTHIHVLWQKGNELRRSTVTLNPYAYPHRQNDDWPENKIHLRDKWESHYWSISSLDQLFIAV